MNLEQVTIQLLLVFFPGVLCAYIVDTFTNLPRASQFQFIVNSFLFGVASYFAYAALAYGIGSVPLNQMSFIKLLSGAEVDGELIVEIGWVCIISIAIGLVAVTSSTYKIHYRILWGLGITQKSGERDVWTFFFSSSGARWVNVRDIKNNLVYQGHVTAFSHSATEAELLLKQVSVSKNDTGEHLYDVQEQYLSLDKGSISVEIQTFSHQS